MSYVNRVGEEVINEPVVTSRVVDYHDRVRWGSDYLWLVGWFINSINFERIIWCNRSNFRFRL